MVYFTSDNHLDRGNLSDVRRWNETVSREDTVFIAGDILSASTVNATFYLEKLNGKKILILGNNDPHWLLCITEKEKSLYFSDIKKNAVIEIASRTVEISHYPKETDCDYLVCGHIHSQRFGGGYRILKNSYSAFNAGVMINGGAPVGFLTLAQHNNAYYARECTSAQIEDIEEVDAVFRRLKSGKEIIKKI